MHHEAARLIAALELRPHPEGGRFRETWRSAMALDAALFTPGIDGLRSAGTSIYYLLEGVEVSRLHRLRGAEIWHHHRGGPLVLHLLPPDGAYRSLILGDPRSAEPCWQAIVPAGCWFGAELARPDDFALLGCTMAPGFDVADCEMATAADVLPAFPGHSDLIRRLT